MEAYIYDKLKEDLVRLRMKFSGFVNTPFTTDEVIKDLENVRMYIEKFAQGGEKEVLLYCIDTLFEIISEGKNKKLFEIIDEGKNKKAFDFCDAVHNISELFCQDNWDKKQYMKIYIKPFRRKYGKEYFKSIEYFFE